MRTARNALSLIILAVALATTLPDQILGQPITNLARACSSGRCPTTSSGTLSDAVNPDETKMNDGSTNGDYAAGSCTTLEQTAGPGSAVWAAVDLEQEKDIGFVKLFSRTDACCVSRMDMFEIRVGNTAGDPTGNPICHEASQTANAVTYMNWAVCDGRGRHVYLVWHPTTTTLVDFCEVAPSAPSTPLLLPPLQVSHLRLCRVPFPLLRSISPRFRSRSSSLRALTWCSFPRSKSIGRTLSSRSRHRCDGTERRTGTRRTENWWTLGLQALTRFSRLA